MAGEQPRVTVTDNPGAHRYEARVDDALAGYVTYRTAAGVMTFLHTEVDPAFEGHGVGSALASSALDDARSRGLWVEPVCPFMAEYIDRHPGYADLLSAQKPHNSRHRGEAPAP